MEKGYFVFDAETDGLFGNFIAIGAIVLRNGKETDVFAGKLAHLEATVQDAWVRENVLPRLADDGFNAHVYADEEALLGAFWDFWMRYRADCYAVADVAYPVEAQLFRRCVLQDEPARRFLSPYPLLDFAAMLFALGIDPDENRQKLDGGAAYDQHNPLADARITGRLLLKYLYK